MKQFFMVILWGTLALDALLILPAVARLGSNLISGVFLILIAAVLVWGYLIAER